MAITFCPSFIQNLKPFYFPNASHMEAFFLGGLNIMWRLWKHKKKSKNVKNKKRETTETGDGQKKEEEKKKKEEETAVEDEGVTP